MFVANQHLCMQGGDGSGFVSVSTSLVQCLQKAKVSRMSNPNIALVALDNPSVQDPRKKLNASTILSSLKKTGQAKWAN
jgi:hypothetical protein